MSIKTNYNVQVEIDPSEGNKPENGVVPTWEDDKFVLKKHEYNYYEFINPASSIQLNTDDTSIIQVTTGTEIEAGTYLVNAFLTAQVSSYPGTSESITCYSKLEKVVGGTPTTLATSDASLVYYGAPATGDPVVIHNISVTAIVELTGTNGLRLVARKGSANYNMGIISTPGRAIMTLLKIG